MRFIESVLENDFEKSALLKSGSHQGALQGLQKTEGNIFIFVIKYNLIIVETFSLNIIYLNILYDCQSNHNSWPRV